MSVQNEINRINANVSNTYTNLESLGATIPSQKNTNNLSSTVSSIKSVLYSEQALTEAEQNQARTNIGALSASEKGSTNGIAELDGSGKIISAQLPAYVDDVIEGTLTTFPEKGEAGKIYVDTSTNLSYRWSGSGYTSINPSLALGETSSTAFRGDWGKQAYEHISNKSNPHGITPAIIHALPDSVKELPANGGNSDTVGGLTFVVSQTKPDAGTPKTTITFVV